MTATITPLSQGGARQPPTHDTPDTPDTPVDLRGLLRTLWRRRGVVGATVGLALGLAALVMLIVPPRYSARVLLALDMREDRVVDIDSVVPGRMPDPRLLNTERDILSSRRLLARLADSQGLLADPEFNAALASPPGRAGPQELADLWRWLEDRMRSWTDPADPALQRPSQSREAVLDAVREAVAVSTTGLSYTLRLTVTTRDPEKSARLANALAALYLEDQRRAKADATTRATHWLNARLADLRARVRAADLAVQRYRADHGLLRPEAAGAGAATESAVARDPSRAALVARVTDAEADLAVAEARRRQVQAMVAQGMGAAAGPVLDSPVIQSLRAQEAEVRRRYAELDARYGARHPALADVRAELGDLGARIAGEVGRIVDSLDAAVAVARDRLGVLQARRAALEAAATRTDAARVDLRALEREAETSRRLLETVLARVKETATQQDLPQADARIIAGASIPTRPSGPHPVPVLAMTGLTALVLGMGLAVLLDGLDPGYRTLRRLQAATGVVGLGMVPRLPRSVLRRRSPAEDVLRRPGSIHAEALRSVHTALTCGRERPPRTVVITSAMPGEGKTSLALSLARLLARGDRRRVLFIEADLRRGGVWRRIGDGRPTPPRTLDAYLRGAVACWQGCVLTDRASGLDMLLAGGHGEGEGAPALLESSRMAALIRDSRDSHDLVLIDSPPLLAVADALMLAARADTTVLAVRWGATPRDGVGAAVSMLRAAQVPIGGAVMTRVDLRKHARYGCGDPASYADRCAAYYAD